MYLLLMCCSFEILFSSAYLDFPLISVQINEQKQTHNHVILDSLVRLLLLASSFGFPAHILGVRKMYTYYLLHSLSV